MNLFDKHWDKNKFATNKDIVDLFSLHKPELNFKPNEKFQYSNTGYALLGFIIEKVSGMSYQDFLNKNIFKPLKMKNTFVYRSRFDPKKIENYALGYIKDSLDNKVLTDSFGKLHYTYYLDGIIGDGMVNSTVEDMLKWDRALYKNYLINDKDKKIIFSPSKLDNNTETSYGYGWFLDKDKVYGKIIDHSGSWAGYITLIERHIENDVTIIVLQNNSTARIDITKYLRQFAYNKPIETPLKLSNEILNSYAGIYFLKSGKEYEIFYKKGYLHVSMNPQVKLKLKPISKTKFVVEGFSPEVTYEFILDEKDNVIKFRAQQIEQSIDFYGERKK